jgi:hypothetical protein
MTVLSWLKLTVSLWLLRKAVKITGWLGLGALLFAVWPVTLVMVVGYVAGWRRGWPPSRLRRAAAGSLLVTAVYLVADVLSQHGR